MSETTPELSIVIPVYQAEGCLHPVYNRIMRTLGALGKSYELILVDDRSRDRSWEILCELARANPNVRAVRLSRNFGQHAAITAGLKLVRGRWAILMDCDGQDPPEQIPRLYAKAHEGYDVVLARRIKRTSLLRQSLSKAYFRALNTFAETSVDGSVGSLSIISKKVVDAYLRFPEVNRHYMLLICWLGFSRAFIDYEHGDREEGKSSYSPRKLIKHAVQGLFFQTTLLLELIILCGFFVSLSGFALATWAALSHSPLPGWTSLVMVILLMGGFNLIAVGIVGLYTGQIFDQVKGRPLFVYDQILQQVDTAPALQTDQVEWQEYAPPAPAITSVSTH